MIRQIARHYLANTGKIVIFRTISWTVFISSYRCTDVPGEFVWQPGVLTQAVMNGYWILLEDLNSATQDVCTVLTGLLENGYLNVPGFRECLQVEPGFQLFMTMR